MFFSAALLLATSAALPTLGPVPSTDDMRCTWRGGGPDMQEWVVILDDEVIEMDLGEFDFAAVPDGWTEAVSDIEPVLQERKPVCS